ncbi:MAG: AAA family ATPase [Thermoanaerobaculaceae bacterium]|nr:AAA family ATPase [Thermoanaerobaculaceae bacterium]
MRKKVFVVGLSGPNAAGKGLASQFFLEKGFKYFSLSDVVREEALKNGLTTSREHLILTGTELRAKYGMSILAERTFEKLVEKSVVDSFRHPSEVEFLKNNCLLFFLLGIDAPQKMRYERAKKRMRDGDSISSFEEFAKKEEEENSSGAGQQIQNTLSLADEVVINDGKKEDLHKKLEPIYNRLVVRWKELKGGCNE